MLFPVLTMFVLLFVVDTITYLILNESLIFNLRSRRYGYWRGVALSWLIYTLLGGGTIVLMFVVAGYPWL